MKLRFGACAVLLCLTGCGDGSTQVPVAPATCDDPKELLLADGRCIRPGVPDDGCAAGFVHDGGYGCDPVLPAEPCASGMMALPGESACRAVMECAAGPWGDIAAEANTQFVDGSYAGGSNDGSADRPWTTIMEAVNAAAAGALVAIAAGSYTEDVTIAGKPVRLRGVCPDEVTLSGTGAGLGAVDIRTAASGSEVSGVTLTGPGVGVALSGSQDVTIDRVRIHATTSVGINVQSDLGATSIVVTGSLVEEARVYGIAVSASTLSVQGSVVRSTQPQGVAERFGRGINVQPDCNSSGCNPATRAAATIVGSVVENNYDSGVFVMASDLLMDGSVVRGTLPRAFDQHFGRGVIVQNCSPVDGCDPAARATATILGSVVADNHEVGVFVGGADAALDGVTVRRTLPRQADGLGGRGIAIQLSCTASECDASAPATATIARSLVDESLDTGLLAADANVAVDSCVVQATSSRQADALFGDGVSAFSSQLPASVTLSETLVADSARAGIGNFGAAFGVGSSRIRCASISLAGENYQGLPPTFDDVGDTRCGCPVADEPCMAESSNLEPPQPL